MPFFSAALRWLDCWGCSGRVEHVRPIRKGKGPSKFPHRSAFLEAPPPPAVAATGLDSQWGWFSALPYPGTNLPALGNPEKRAGKEQGGGKQGWAVGWCLVAKSGRRLSE